MDEPKTLARRGRRAGAPLGNDDRDITPNIEFSVVVCSRYWYGRVLEAIHKGLAEDRMLCRRALEREGELGGGEKNAERRTFLVFTDIAGLLLCALDKNEMVPPGLEAGFCGRLSMEVGRVGGEHGGGRKMWLRRNGIYMVLSGGKRQRA